MWIIKLLMYIIMRSWTLVIKKFLIHTWMLVLKNYNNMWRYVLICHYHFEEYSYAILNIRANIVVVCL